MTTMLGGGTPPSNAAVSNFMQPLVGAKMGGVAPGQSFTPQPLPQGNLPPQSQQYQPQAMPQMQQAPQGFNGGFSPLGQGMQNTGSFQALPQITTPPPSAMPSPQQNLAAFGSLAGAQRPQAMTAQQALTQSQQYIAANTPQKPSLPTLTPAQKQLMQNRMIMNQFGNFDLNSNAKGASAALGGAMPIGMYGQKFGGGGIDAFKNDLAAIQGYNKTQAAITNWKPPATSYAPLPTNQNPTYSTVKFQ